MEKNEPPGRRERQGYLLINCGGLTIIKTFSNKNFARSKFSGSFEFTIHLFTLALSASWRFNQLVPPFEQLCSLNHTSASSKDKTQSDSTPIQPLIAGGSVVPQYLVKPSRLEELLIYAILQISIVQN